MHFVGVSERVRCYLRDACLEGDGSALTIVNTVYLTQINT